MGLRGPKPGTKVGGVGKKGRSGRKGFGYEYASWNKLNEMFFGEKNLKDIAAIIKTGKYKPEDMFTYKLMLGNVDLFKVVLQKLFPDSLLVKRAPIVEEPLTDDEKKELSELVERALNEFNDIGYELKVPKPLALNGSTTVESSVEGNNGVRQGAKKRTRRK